MYICLSDALGGFSLGIVASILANHYWELRTRHQVHKQAKELEGTWTAHDMLNAREVDFSKTMENAGPTVITPKPHWWSADQHILDGFLSEKCNCG
jgi:hypothetical protein